MVVYMDVIGLKSCSELLGNPAVEGKSVVVQLLLTKGSTPYLLYTFLSFAG